jgi:hypothetical protein
LSSQVFQRGENRPNVSPDATSKVEKQAGKNRNSSYALPLDNASYAGLFLGAVKNSTFFGL